MWNDIRKIIKEVREKRNLSQADLATMIGKEQSYIYCVESGQIIINEDIVDEIVCALDIDLRRELYRKYRVIFEQNRIDYSDYYSFVQMGCSCKALDKSTTLKVSERRTARVQMVMRPSTKQALKEYAQKNDTSVNEVLECLARSYILAKKNGEVLCQYAGITFNPNSSMCMKRGERKSERIQLLLTETTKKGIQQIAEAGDTSLSDMIHKLADSFLWEWYR